MAQQLTVRAQSLLDQVSKEPQIIVEIEGIDLIFGARPILKFIRWDEDNVCWDDELITWDGLVEDTNSRSFISFQGTTKNIGQQIYPDKEGSSSFSAANVQLLDKNGEISKLFSLNNIGEILGRRASFYYGFAKGVHPEDSIPVLRGIITDFYSEPGSVNVTITHPESLKRQSIFNQYSSFLTATIDDTVTTIPVSSTESLIEEQDALESYIRVEDEIMQVVSKTSNSIEVIRSRFGSIAESHDADTELVSNYRIQGSPIDLALKLQLSDKGNNFETSVFQVKQFLAGQVIIDSYDIARETGITPGDTLNLGVVGLFTVAGSGTNDAGDSFFTVEEPLTDNASPGLTLSWKSKWNTLPDGLGMGTNAVDVASFENVATLFSAAFVDYDFLLDETIEDAKSFISKEIFFPQAMYSTPRDARASVRYLSPPLTIDQLPTIDDTNITNIKNVRLRRSTDKYFYNSVLHKYGKSKRSGDFLAISQLISGDAVNLLPTNLIGNKQLNIESQGLVRSNSSKVAIDSAASRMLDRYSGAATYVEGVKLTAKAGLNLEPTDVVYFGGESTQFTDLDTGLRNAPIKKYEIINIKFDLKTFTPSVDLIDTGYSLIGVYAVFSPSSFIGAGSTTTKLCLDKFLDVCEVDIEREKWEAFVGANIRVRSEDYTRDEQTIIQGLDPQDPRCLIVSPALSSTPTIGDIIELDLFHNLDDTAEITEDIKQRFTFTMDRASLTTVTSTTVFDVDDTTGMVVGAQVRVHSEDYNLDSDEDFVIIGITGSTITLDKPLEFLPATGYEIDILSFPNQDGYKLL